MYNKLVKMLRVCGDSNNSCGNYPIFKDGSCPYGEWEFAAEKYMLEAADIIEELSAKVGSLQFFADNCVAGLAERGGNGMTEYIAADVRSVVYYKDCKHRGNTSDCPFCWLADKKMGDEHFCSFGEKREA